METLFILVLQACLLFFRIENPEFCGIFDSPERVVFLGFYTPIIPLLNLIKTSLFDSLFMFIIFDTGREEFMSEKKKNTLHMIGNAHLDPVWLWSWEEGYSEALATFRSAIERLEENPRFVFTRGCAMTYEWVEKTDPELFKKIKKYVKLGRWNIVNGWWEQPDINIPCGEAYIRQGVYGKSYFRKKFGVEVTVGYNVDSFGHNAMLPQILKRSGFKSYVFMRPGPHEKKLPYPIFWWESPDGSRVLGLALGYFMDGYNLWVVDKAEIEKSVKKIPEGITSGVCFYGIGDHGGGPTKKMIESIIELNKKPDMPNLLFSTVEEYLKDVLKQKKDLPVVKDELQMHAVGCYTLFSAVKVHNRKSENALLTSEKFNSIGVAAFGFSYPKERFDEAWKTLLFTEFHDILAGSATKEGTAEMLNFYGEVRSIAGKNLVYCLEKLMMKIGISCLDGQTPLVIFNPLSWTRKSLVEFDIGGNGEKLELIDDKGRNVPFQITTPGCNMGPYKCRLIFTAEVPSLGYRVYKFRYTEKPVAATIPTIYAGKTGIENARFKLELDAAGCLKSIYDKEIGRELLTGAGNKLVVLNDESDTWSHGFDRFRDEAGYFGQEGGCTVSLIEEGPLRSAIRVKNSFGASKAEYDIILYRDLPFIDFRLVVYWHEKLKMCKAAFPFRLNKPKVLFEIPYGVIERAADGKEVPGQKWLGLFGKDYWAALSNDNRYGFDVLNSEARISLLRSPLYSWDTWYLKDNNKLKENKEYEYMDQGLHEFRYRLSTGTGEFKTAGTERDAYDLNNPLIVIPSSSQKGKFPGSFSFISVAAPNVILEAIKQAEDGKGIILRFVETKGIAAEVKVRFDLAGKKASFKIKPYEIRTFKAKFKPGFIFTEANILD